MYDKQLGRLLLQHISDISFEEQSEKSKTRLSGAFIAWRIFTANFKERKVCPIGRICANVAAARARGSKEPEWFLALS